MKILVVTEKCNPKMDQRDGGARLVETLQKAFGENLCTIQFGPSIASNATWSYEYPFKMKNRFERRLANAEFIAQHVKALEEHFTHIIFIHISMQFGLLSLPLREDLHVWTFPMFLTPSYLASGETVPESYFEIEKKTLTHSKNIITPSYLERTQLIEHYSVSEERIHVIPRGIDTTILNPQIRTLKGPPKFCSIGSIKPQKNTLGLIDLFSHILHKYPDAFLKIIGPVQDTDYYEQVLGKIHRLELAEKIEWMGYIPPPMLALAIQDTHIHLSTSTCETFGRSIFETLASGLPNIAQRTGNAAANFLDDLPYACFIDETIQSVKVIEDMLKNLPKLSQMALEIGNLYDDSLLSRLLAAKICNHITLAITDFDGTLYHKNDPEKTSRCVEAFSKFPVRVVCSARPIHELLIKLKDYNLTVDWIIGYSGSIVTNGLGQPLWFTPIEEQDVMQLERLIPHTARIEKEGHILQFYASAEIMPNLFGFRREVYQGTAFVANWEASKLRSFHRLLKHINWTGRIQAFGDGPFDRELLTYFDGTFITSSNKCEIRQKNEIVYV